MAALLSFVFIVIAGFIGFVMYARFQEAKAQTQKLLTLNSMVRDIQHRYRDVIVDLFQQGIIDIHAKQKLLALANNYFIYQTINQVNISHLVDITDTFMNAIAERAETGNCNDERLAELLATLVDHIPTTTRNFNAEYYLNFAPGLIYGFAEKVNEIPTTTEINGVEQPQQSQPLERAASSM